MKEEKKKKENPSTKSTKKKDEVFLDQAPGTKWFCFSWRFIDRFSMLSLISDWTLAIWEFFFLYSSSSRGWPTTQFFIEILQS
jgi:hypothetical protein